MTLIFEPGNEDINNFCRKAVSEGIFESRIQCWDEYKDFRDQIPEL